MTKVLLSVYAFITYSVSLMNILMCALTIRSLVEISCININVQTRASLVIAYSTAKNIQISIDKNIERPQLMCDYPLNLSILIRGGKETNRDSLSSGERNGISPSRRIIGLIVYRSIPCKGGSIILHI